MSESELLEFVTPIAESMQIGWDIDSYEQFSESFTEGMRNAVNKKNYDEQRKRIFADLGTHTELAFIAMHKNPDNIIVFWKLHCEKREMPALVIYTFVEKNQEVLIHSATIDY